MEPGLSPQAVTLFCLLVAGSLVVNAVVLRRLLRRQPLVPYEPRRPAPWTGFDAGLVLLFYLAPSLAGWILIWFTKGADAAPAVEHPPAEQAQALLAGSVISLAVGLFALALLRFRAQAQWRDMGFVRGKLAADVRLGLAAFLAFAPLLYLLQQTMHQLFPHEPHPIVKLLMEHPHASLFAACGLAAVIVAPLTEELLFRLVLQGCLENIDEKVSGTFCVNEKVPDTFSGTPELQPANDSRPPSRGILSIAVSSFVFAAVHQWPDQVPLFFLALVLGYLYHQTHRILPSIVLHLCLNLTSLTMLWLSIR